MKAKVRYYTKLDGDYHCCAEVTMSAPETSIHGHRFHVIDKSFARVRQEVQDKLQALVDNPPQNIPEPEEFEL